MPVNQIANQMALKLVVYRVTPALAPAQNTIRYGLWLTADAKVPQHSDKSQNIQQKSG